MAQAWINLYLWNCNANLTIRSLKFGMLSGVDGGRVKGGILKLAALKIVF